MGTDKQTWAEWATRRPIGAGYLFLGETYLPLAVTMWHQLHCLNHIRTLISAGDDGSDHTLHCFRYLRQGILCNADPTLEPWTRPSFDVEGREIFPGDGVTHTCKNFQHIYDWTMQRNVRNIEKCNRRRYYGHWPRGNACNAWHDVVYTYL
jgi:hypothetical protein